MKNVFLALAILGTVVPYAFFLSYFGEHDVDLFGFVGAVFVNGAAGGFSADLLISSFAFWLFLFFKQAERIWLYVLLNLTVGLSLALPLYFYMQAREQKEAQA